MTTTVIAGSDRDRWLLDQLPMLLRLATALTGEADVAAELVAAALTRRPRVVRGLATQDFPESGLRALVVQEYLGHPTSSLGTGLAGLPARTRAAVVLRDGEQVTAAEAATMMDRPLGRVLADLAAVPTTYGAEIAALGAAAPAPTAVLERLGPARRRRRGRRSGALALALLLALVGGAAVAVPTLVLPRLPADVRPAGEWRFSHAVEPTAGWVLRSRALTPSSEVTELERTNATEAEMCDVEVSVRGRRSFRDADVRQHTSLHGRPAVLGTDYRGIGFLAWGYGQDAWAQVSCAASTVPEGLLRSVAAMVRFRAEPLAVPMAFSRAPAGYRIAAATEFLPTHAVVVELVKQGRSDGAVTMMVIGPLPPGTEAESPQVTVAGRVWYAPKDLRQLCSTGDPAGTVCVSGVGPSGDRLAPSAELLRVYREVQSVASTLVIADLGRRDTWTDARQALPR